MPPEVTDWVGTTLAVFGAMPESFAALGLSLGSTKLLDPVSWGPIEKRWRAGSLRPRQRAWRDFVGADQRGDVGGSFCDHSRRAAWRLAMAAPDSQQQQLAELPPLTFAASLVVGPIVMRRSAFVALGGWNESYSLPGEPGLGMESELVARLWINGWSAGVACPTARALWRNLLWRCRDAAVARRTTGEADEDAAHLAPGVQAPGGKRRADREACVEPQPRAARRRERSRAAFGLAPRVGRVRGELHRGEGGAEGGVHVERRGLQERAPIVDGRI